VPEWNKTPQKFGKSREEQRIGLQQSSELEPLLSVLQKVEKAASAAAQDYDSREIIQMQSTSYKFLVNSLSCFLYM
jgi:hypothetical protein